MIEFLVENLLLLPFLFVTYLVLEAMEAKAGGAFERSLGRVRSIGPVFGALAGAFPQCGVAASASSLYSGGVITAGTLIAVFLSTSDELVPVLLNCPSVGAAVPFKIVGIKVAAAIVAGLSVNLALRIFKGARAERTGHHIGEICSHSHCGCGRRKGIVVPALIHTLEVFVFILAVSSVFKIVEVFYGTGWIEALALSSPLIGELVGGVAGLIPNCAISVVCAQMYAEGLMSPGALMASSFTGCGVGFVVLFRQNRDRKANLSLLAAVYLIGCLLGFLTGWML